MDGWMDGGLDGWYGSGGVSGGGGWMVMDGWMDGNSLQHRPTDDHAVLTDRMAAERERGDDTEVAAATPQRPKQITVRLRTRGDKATVGQHHVGRNKIVERETKAAGEAADSAAQSHPGNPGGGQET